MKNIDWLNVIGLIISKNNSDVSKKIIKEIEKEMGQRFQESVKDQ